MGEATGAPTSTALRQAGFDTGCDAVSAQTTQVCAARNTRALATPVDTLCKRYGVWQHFFDEQQQQQDRRARRLAARLRPVLRASLGVAAYTQALRARLAATYTTAALVKVCTCSESSMLGRVSSLGEVFRR